MNIGNDGEIKLIRFLFVGTFLYLLIFKTQSINKYVATIIIAISSLILTKGYQYIQHRENGKNN